MPIISKSEFILLNKTVDIILNGEMGQLLIINDDMIGKLNSNYVEIDEIEMQEKYDLEKSFIFEKEIFYEIENGNPNGILDIVTYEKLVVGKLVLDNDYLRQIKNAFIAGCTLASRAAIRGGLNVTESLELSNYYISKAENQLMPEVVESMVNEMFMDYANRVRQLIKVETKTELISMAIRYIDSNLTEIGTLDEISDHLNVSKNYLLNKFKQETGISIVDYINKSKIEKAKALLRTTDMSIIEISNYLSFNTQSYFTTIFKKHENKTPLTYRNLF